MTSLPLRDCILGVPPTPCTSVAYRATNDAILTVRPLDMLGIVGASASIECVRQSIVRYAPRLAGVLILGETGTGKELVARALHSCSRRPEAPLVTANAAALPPDLLGSMLFGHERGAFTGALTRHRGLFEQAHGGTLFLDEVGELDALAQAHLLRVIETGELRPLGCERSRFVEVRVIAATNRDLAGMVAEGRFRDDLYYRLTTLAIEIPPLRDRLEDLVPIARHLLRLLRAEVGDRSLSDAAMQALAGYSWPGNVRQLRNVLARAAINSDAPMLGAREITAALSSEPGCSLPFRRKGVPMASVVAAVSATRGNVTAASRALGIPRTTLRDRVRSLDRSPAAHGDAPSKNP